MLDLKGKDAVAVQRSLVLALSRIAIRSSDQKRLEVAIFR